MPNQVVRVATAEPQMAAWRARQEMSIGTQFYQYDRTHVEVEHCFDNSRQRWAVSFG